MFQDIKNTLRTDSNFAGLPCTDINMAIFDEFRRFENKYLQKLFKGPRRMSAFDIWAYYI